MFVCFYNHLDKPKASNCIDSGMSEGNVRSSAVHRYKFVVEKDRFKCGFNDCTKNQYTEKEFEHHLKTKHSIRKNWKCPHCGETIESNKRKVKPGEIIRHLQLHGPNVYWCGECDKMFSTDFDVQLHVARNHPVSKFTYHHKTLDVNGATNTTKEIRVLLECNLCQQWMPTTSAALEHFKMNHAGAVIDFTAFEVVNCRTSNMKVNSTPPQKSFLLQQHLVCDLCDTKMATKDKMLEHYQQKHPSRPLAIRFSQMMCFNNLRSASALEFSKSNASFDRHILFTCAHCDGLRFNFGRVRDVFEHWKKTHDSGYHQLPFHFYADPLVSCLYCDVLSTFQGLVEHFKMNHPKEMFAAVQPLHHDQCGLCPFTATGEDILDHFCRDHPTILQENLTNPVRLTEETVDQLLKINVRKKLKCARCSDVFESESNLRDHCLEVHKTLQFDHTEFIDNESVQLFSGCCADEIDQIEFFEHLTNHQRIFNCSQCSFGTNDAFVFMNHGIDEHKVHQDACTLDLNWLKSWYWHSKYVFGNGLILNKHNLVGTSIDDSKRFMELLQAFVLEREKSFYKDQ